MPSILFICTANRYRSPIAEACFKNELITRNIQEIWDIQSAGTWTKNGMAPLPEAVISAQQLGLDIQKHRSREVTASMMASADLIVVMERDQQEALQIEFKSCQHKVTLLTKVTEGFSIDIADPIRFHHHDQTTTAEICRLIKVGFDQLCSAANQIPTPLPENTTRTTPWQYGAG